MGTSVSPCCKDERRRTSAAADRLARRWLSPAEAAALAAVAVGPDRCCSPVIQCTLNPRLLNHIASHDVACIIRLSLSGGRRRARCALHAAMDAQGGVRQGARQGSAG